jgi:outer membrane protein assembly factor BamB
MLLRFESARVYVPMLIALLAAGQPAQAEDWPRWRGPNQDGISRTTNLLKEWPADGPRELWRVKLFGGFSSVVVASGRVFTQTKEKNEEVILCLDAATGKDVWRYRYACDYAAYPTFTGGGMPASRTGPRATPAIDGERVYAQGATGILLCLDAKTGKRIWRQDLLQIGGRDCPRHGYCGCPLIVGERIFVQPGGSKGKSLAALDKHDGHVLWQSLDDPIGQSTPVWADVGGTPQVIFFTGVAAVGVSPADGRLLWRYPWRTQYDLNIATPIYHDGKVFVSSNYGTGAAVFRLTGKAEPETLWKSSAMQNHFSSSVLYQGHLYGFSTNRLRCVDFATGKVKWDAAGLGRGSLLIADGYLILLGDHGQLVLAKATPEAYTPISRCQVGDPTPLTWSVPVLCDGRLFIRSENELRALQVGGK